MVNPVGSCENINWQKKWIAIKRSVVLTEQQRMLIIGSLLGDGTMRIGKGAVNANFKVEHGLQQKEYVVWKYNILNPLVFTEAKISYRYRNNGEQYPKSWWFRTIRHPLITNIFKRYYTGESYRVGRKIIPKDITMDLCPFSIAIWVMDDGSYSKGRIDISTYSFTLPEIMTLEESLKRKFAIQAKHYRDRDKGYRMYFNQHETEKLILIIEPFIILSMKYKIGFRDPVTTGLLHSSSAV